MESNFLRNAPAFLLLWGYGEIGKRRRLKIFRSSLAGSSPAIPTSRMSGTAQYPLDHAGNMLAWFLFPLKGGMTMVAGGSGECE